MASGDTRRSPRLQVVVSDAQGRPLSPSLGRWLAAVAPARARGAVNIALVSDARVRALNRRYRRLNKTTDVLSFPAVPESFHPETPRVLGDIVIARGVARRQATMAGHAEATELKVLALHGLLHLLGYDHDAKDDAGAMTRVERRLRKLGGLREGLIERQ